MKRKPIASVAAVIATGLFCVLAIGIAAVWHASQALHSEEHSYRAEHEIGFTVRPLAPIENVGFESVIPPAVFMQAAQFQQHLYIASPSGLLVYEPSGEFVKRYSVGTDLPGSPLIAVTPALLADSKQPELIVATASEGILAYNGQGFRQIFPSNPETRAISAILATSSGHLLIGTKKRGVLVYDGTKITPLHVTLSDCYVTALAGDDSDLWVGTLDRGILHFHAGETDSFTDREGLPDSQVASLTIRDRTTYVGTPLGVAVFSEGRFSHVLAQGVFATSLLATADQIYVGSEDQGVLSIPLHERRLNLDLPPQPDISEVRELFALGDSIFAVARNGLYRRKPHAFSWQQVLQPEAGVLSDRNVSAIAADKNGRLWIGYFDRGLDVVAANQRTTHIEDEHVFCVNRVFLDSKTGGVDVATANGLVRFDESGKEQQVLTRSDGLIADNVSDVAAYGDGLALATPAGLTFLDASGARSMYAFHGLVNNHVYALGISGDRLMAGTLGGISLLEKESVAVNYTTSNSTLKHNWITAIVPVGSEWMVGTYGAGILGLDASGHFHSFDVGTGSFEVNPNAMLVNANFVLAGTLGEGLYLYDRASGRWSVIEQGLPSLNVTALAAANGYIYVGTDNGLVRIPEQMLHS